MQIDVAALQERLGLPLYPISAKYGTGCPRAMDAIGRAVAQQPEAYQIPNLVDVLSDQPVAIADMEMALAGVVQMPSPTARTLTNAIDGIMLHPFFGLPLFFASMFGVFWVIWNVGLPSADPVDAVTGWVQSNILEPLFSPLPTILQGLLLDGIWTGFAALLSFVPLVAIFFIVMGILEGSGYLSRAAYLMDALMGRLGLDGRSFVLQMMGFGCNVPAIMGTRVMRSRGMRLLAMLVIPFSLCSPAGICFNPGRRFAQHPRGDRLVFALPNELCGCLYRGRCFKSFSLLPSPGPLRTRITPLPFTHLPASTFASVGRNAGVCCPFIGIHGDWQ